MTDFIKPSTMILTLQTLRHMGRYQLSIGLTACFRLSAPHLDALLTETASHKAWARLAGPLHPIDSGIPAKAQRLVVHDGYMPAPAADFADTDPPLLLGNETIQLESKLRGRPGIAVRLPGIRAQCFAEWRHPGAENVRKLDIQIESVCLSPYLDCAWIVYRAITPLRHPHTGDIARISADWGASDQPTARPGHRLPTGADRCTIERYRHTTEREASRHKLARSTCAS